MTVDELTTINLHSQELGQYLFDRCADLVREGVSVAPIKAVLIEYYDWLGASGRDEDQDAVADVMDSLVGQCSPSARLVG